MAFITSVDFRMMHILSALMLSGLFCFTVLNADQQPTESFVVQKKKSCKAGGKSKEKVCREYGQIAKTSGQVIQKVASVQSVGLEHTTQYLDGEDPFDGKTKAQMQEYEHRLHVLDQEMQRLCKACDDLAQFRHKMFS